MLPVHKVDLRALFDKVLDLGPLDRANFLRDLQLKSPLQYKELKNLLIAHEGPSAFFEQEGGIWTQIAPTDFTGKRFGAYSIVREIGRGGMGAVYEATRADDAFHKTVAIKLISGMVLSDSFRKERQILAQLEHPNIARLLDGGAGEDGLLYLIMEYVDGKPLDQYIESKALPVEGILKLFIDVAGAVSYAHRNLIVHRDLKPSNILVTEQGEVKLLDFGIAKVLDPKREDATTVAVRLTPEFASPEQIRGESISTASDVYSLGVLLFHALTGGARPYRATSQAVPDILQSVLDSVVPKPSAVVSPIKAKRLRGDLDNIVLKAMAKEPERRYTSVDQLREDIERHLNGRPVLAQGDNWGYRAGKFIRRHAWAVGAAALITLSIGAGVVSTLRQARIAREEREAAVARYQSVRSLATAMLFDVNESLKSIPGAGPARKQAVLAALNHLEELAKKSGDDFSLTEDLAGAYEQTAEIMASLFEDSKHGASLAIPALMKAIRLREKLPPTLKLAESQRQLGNNQINSGQVEKAIGTYQLSLAVALRQPDLPERERVVALAHSNLCTAHTLLGKHEAAGPECKEAVRILDGIAPEANADLPRLKLLTRMRYGAVLMKLQRMDEARNELGEAARLLDPLQPAALPVAEELLSSFLKMPNAGKLRATTLWKRGVMLGKQGERDQALESFEMALRMAGGEGPTMPQVIAFAEACNLHAQALEEQCNGQVQRAVDTRRRALNRLAESTAMAASLLRPELEPALATRPQ
ncbi:MAG: serine/threonine protein kinase [Acidobacteria bacterium]|nr:serine/threonine protein kinase [Acidobacteriota bacterium]